MWEVRFSLPIGLLLLLATAVQAAQKPTVGFFFWGYGDNGKPLVPPSIFEKMKGNETSAPIATHVIAGSGHQVTTNGTWIIPNTTSDKWLSDQINSAHAAGLGFVPLIAGCSLAELRGLVLNASRVTRFVEELVEDAMTND